MEIVSLSVSHVVAQTSQGRIHIKREVGCPFPVVRRNDLERRAKRAELLVGMGELPSARQALEGAELAPGTNETLQMLSDHSRRPPEIREPLPVEVTNHVPEVPFELSEKIFLKNLRIAKRGASAGSHLRVLFDSRRCQGLFFKVAEWLARADVFDAIISVIRMGRMTALRSTRAGCECIAHMLQGLTELNPRATVVSIDGISAS